MVDDLLNGNPYGNLSLGLDIRASRVPLDNHQLVGELWVGGSFTALGEPFAEDAVDNAWLVDCAGELPRELMARAARSFWRVFEDIEWIPGSYDRIDALAQQLAGALRGNADALTGDQPEGGSGGASADAQPPERVYVFCKQGFNRSGLLTGRILRALGTPPQDAVTQLRELRPGALTNETFVDLIHR
ncbi:MAG: hypothetical protein QF664_00590 [Dehalococcoidia bacterium]|jgi:hypothetical protein|nr:hypothetical protein [Dehalococcoidia bacterium]